MSHEDRHEDRHQVRHTEADFSRTMIGFVALQAPQPRPAAAPGQVLRRFGWGIGLPDEVVQGFTHAAMAVASLRHPHVVQVAEAGRLPDGTPFVALEPLRGQTLDERTGGRPLAAADVMPIVRGVASALAAAHAAGVAHGELRADSIFMAEAAGYRYGFPKLLDFGVPRLAVAARAAGRVVPEPPADVVAPEQRRNPDGRPDPRADQFALAALACRLLTGAGPAAGAGLAAAAFARVWSGPGAGERPLAPAVGQVLARATSWSPERRFDSVEAFVEALEAALAERVEAAVAEREMAPPPVRVPVVAAPVTAPAPVQAAPAAPDPASLTQQFFAEGERQEAAAAGAANDNYDDDHGASEPRAEAARLRGGQPAGDAAAVAAAAADDDGLDPNARTGTFDRIPRRRGSMVALGMVALAALAVAGWTVVSLSGARVPAGPPPAAPAASAAPRAVPPPGTAPATAATTVEPSARAARVAAHGAAPLPRTQPAPFAAVAATIPAAAPVPVAAAAPVAAPASSPVPPPAASTASPSPAAQSPAAPAPASAPAPAASAAPPVVDEDVTQPGEEAAGEPVVEDAPGAAPPAGAPAAPAGPQP